MAARAVAAFVLLWSLSTPCAGMSQPLTVARALESTRAMTDWQSQPVFISPDGRRYVLMLIRGDIARDGVAVSLIAGRTDSLASAVRSEPVARLFTRAWASSASLTLPGSNFPVWLDNERIALFWEDENAVKQVVSVNVATRETRYLTRHPTEVTDYAVGAQGTIVYSARVDYSQSRRHSAQLLQHGFAVGDENALALLADDISGPGLLDRIWNHERFIITEQNPQARRIEIDGAGVNRFPAANQNGFAPPYISPNGRWAIAAGTPSRAPGEWSGYKQAYFQRQVLKPLRSHPDEGGRMITQLFLIDLHEATGRPLWNAPTQGPVRPTLRLAWSPNSRAALLGPTFLPIDQADAAGLQARAVAEVDVATGEYRQVPVPQDLAVKIVGLRWLSQSIIELSLEDARNLIFAKHADQWRPVTPDEVQAVPRTARSQQAAAVRIELHQNLNTPPAFYAVEKATGSERLILDLNPKLRRDVALGRVEMMHWQAPDGLRWTARLYYPTEFKRGRRYPLVIQTYGAAPATEFSLYGPAGPVPGSGPVSAVYLAQALANRQIAVLQLGGPDGSSPVGNVSSVSDLTALTVGREAAVRHLEVSGIVDSHKVALEGFSAMGRQVEHALTFSDFPYAAAIAADYSTHNYGEWILYGQAMADFPDITPFSGNGLKAYLELAPAFQARRIRTPLQMQYYGPGIHNVIYLWEMFAGLRHLERAVELYVAPDIERGVHRLQNPRQLLTVQQRALDWWCFWLKHEEDSDPAKAPQYASWRVLREKHEATLRQPRPSLLKWTATPIGSRAGQ